MISLGQLKEIEDLREVWQHEALDFTPWLAKDENIVLLSDAVGFWKLPLMKQNQM
ncbi:MAG: hypothetical protein PUH54_09435 [Oscillospiraceae bacterium]|nr:hypothetical protein [Oscillospiraceae bacterium]